MTDMNKGKKESAEKSSSSVVQLHKCQAKIIFAMTDVI